MASLIPQQIEVSAYPQLGPGDRCSYIGEYQSGAGYGAGETNQLIYNLKKGPGASDKELWWKRRAIAQAAEQLRQVLDLDALRREWTIVPGPSSKIAGHPEYDPRTLNILLHLQGLVPGLDVRPVLVGRSSRSAQHDGDRMTIDELVRWMTWDPTQLAQPLRPNVLVFDDVFTKGSTFKAMQRLLLQRPEVTQVMGIFLARSVRPPTAPVDLAAFLEALLKKDDPA